MAMDKKEFFRYPVPLDLAPDYYEVIEEPMSFSEIQEKLALHQYSTVDEFEVRQLAALHKAWGVLMRHTHSMTWIWFGKTVYSTTRRRHSTTSWLKNCKNKRKSCSWKRTRTFKHCKSAMNRVLWMWTLIPIFSTMDYHQATQHLLSLHLLRQRPWRPLQKRKTCLISPVSAVWAVPLIYHRAQAVQAAHRIATHAHLCTERELLAMRIYQTASKNELDQVSKQPRRWIHGHCDRDKWNKQSLNYPRHPHYHPLLLPPHLESASERLHPRSPSRQHPRLPPPQHWKARFNPNAHEKPRRHSQDWKQLIPTLRGRPNKKMRQQSQRPQTNWIESAETHQH